MAGIEHALTIGSARVASPIDLAPTSKGPWNMGNADLTVIVPAYNEVATIDAILDRVAASPVVGQLIVVDDGSTDGTWAAIESRGRREGWSFEAIRHPVNSGKGAAIRTGLASVRCEFVVVQDADLEYDPADYEALVAPLVADEADVVFGSRYLKPGRPLPLTINRLCVYLLNLMVLALYGRRVTDEATCYKAFRTSDLEAMDLRCARFEFCPEVTAKACRMRLRFAEVPIAYHPRTLLEGKKIGWRDGVEAISTLLAWRFRRFRPRERGRDGQVLLTSLPMTGEA